MDLESAENEACATSVGDVDADFAAELDKVVLLEGESPKGEVVGDLGFGRTTLTRLELSLAGFSEKITNLRIFMMRLATMESEFEAFALEKDDIEHDSVEKVLEFDLLSGILDSEVRELNKLLGSLQTEIADTRERISSCTHLGEIFMVMKEKLCDFEEYVKQSEEQISVLKMQSVDFQRNLSSFKRGENGKQRISFIYFFLLFLCSCSERVFYYMRPIILGSTSVSCEIDCVKQWELLSSINGFFFY